MKKNIDQIVKMRRDINERMKSLTEEYRLKQEGIFNDLKDMQNSCPHPSDAIHVDKRVEYGLPIITKICTLCGSEVSSTKNKKGSNYETFKF